MTEDDRDTIDDETEMDIRVVEASISPWVEDLGTGFPHWPDNDDHDQPPTFTQAIQNEGARERFRELCDDSGLAADLIRIVLKGIDTDLDTEPPPDNLFEEAKERVEAEDDSLTIQLVDIALRYLMFTDSNSEDENRGHAAAMKNALSQPEIKKKAKDPAEADETSAVLPKPSVPAKPVMAGEGSGADGDKPGSLRQADTGEEEQSTPPEDPTPQDLRTEPRYKELIFLAKAAISKAQQGNPGSQHWMNVTYTDLWMQRGVGAFDFRTPVVARDRPDGSRLQAIKHKSLNIRTCRLLAEEIKSLAHEAGVEIKRLR